MLLITNYWYPWNSSGAFRWLHLSEYLDFDVLTTKKTQGFYDETMPKGRCNTLYRHGRNLPAVLSGLYLAIRSVFIRADRYVYTCPPETLLVGAYINQLLGRKVYVDLRDKIDRHTQPHKWLIPIYKWLYRRIKNVCVCMQFFDPEKTVIRHGYDIDKKDDNKFPVYLINSQPAQDYNYYCQNLKHGMGRDYGEGFNHYTSSSVITLRHLGNPIKGNLHPELFEFEPQSWEEISKEMSKFLGMD